MANTLKIKRGTNATIPQGQLAEPLFTSDTYDLYIGKGAGGNQRIQNYIASGTSSQFLKGDGSLDSTSYQPLITAGTTLQYYRGDKTFQTLDTSVVPENGPIYFTEPRVRATVLTGLNLSGGGTIAATDSILTAFGKVQNQISALVGGATYQGTWNASTNTPTLASGTGTKGYYYVVSVAGSTNLDGITDWKIGDWAIFNGTTWDKVDNTDAVSSVNGFTGAVNLALDNISDVSAASPTNAQLLRFNGTSSLWENWTPTFEPALTKGNLTEATSSVLTITGGTGAVIGSGTTIAVAQASGSTSGYLSSTDWTTFNNKQAALTNPVTGTGTNNYIPKFTATGSTIGDSSLYYSQGANSNSYTFGSVGAGAIYNLSQFNIYSNSTSEMFFQWGSNKYLYIGNSSGNVSFSSINTGTHNYNNIIYYNGASASDRYISFGTEAVDRLTIEQNGDIQLNKYTSNGFVKTSGGNGTLSVDTTSYLPLTGGTLTGALSGTSATFSSALSELNVISTGASNIGSITIQGGEGANAQLTLQADDADNASDITILRQADGGTFSIMTNNGGVNALQIAATTGAASFSSSVTAGSNIILPSGFELSYGNGNVSILGNTSTNTMELRTNNSTKLTIASTGAATFSSSVTAGGIIATSGTGLNSSVRIANTTATTGVDWHLYSLNNGNFGIYNNTAGAYALQISSTGAATFTTASNSTITNTFQNTDTTNTNSRNYFNVIAGNVTTSIQAIHNDHSYINVTNNLYFQSGGGNKMTMLSSGNVGIGTTSIPPDHILQVHNAAAYARMALTNTTSGVASGDGLIFQLEGTTAIIKNQEADALKFGTNGSETQLVLANGGNVGIGTASPQAPLHIIKALGNDVIAIGETGTNTRFAIGQEASYTGNYINSRNIDLKLQAYLAGGTGGNIIFQTANDGTANVVERMRITSGGNVGIGVSSNLTAALTANGGISIGNGWGTSGATLEMSTDNVGSGGAAIVVSYWGSSSYGPLVFNVGNAERMRIRSAGEISFMPTTWNYTNPSTAFRNSDFGAGGLLFRDTTDAYITSNAYYNTGGDWVAKYTTSTGTGVLKLEGGNLYWNSYDGSVTAGSTYSMPNRLTITKGGEVWINYTSDQGAYYLQVNGNVLASGYFESSDIRLKDVLTNSYSENFSAIEFMWKDKRDDKKHWGYAAQDVMKYIPDAIEVNNDGMMTVNYNEAHTWKIAQLEAKIVELEAKLK